MDSRWIKSAVCALAMVAVMILFSIVMRYTAGDFENNNNFNRYDIKVITDPKTGCEYLI